MREAEKKKRRLCVKGTGPVDGAGVSETGIKNKSMEYEKILIMSVAILVSILGLAQWVLEFYGLAESYQ